LKIVRVSHRELEDKLLRQFSIGEYWNSVLLVSEAIAALVCSPLFGYILDTSGTRQGPYLSGLVLLFASMVILMASNSVAWYVVARVLQGAATAMVSVAGLSIVTDTVDQASLGQMIGYIGTAMTLGFMSGPLLGGLVYEVGGFHAVFGMAVGIVALDFFLRLAVVEKRVAERWLCIADNERPTEENGYVSEQPPYGAIRRRTPSFTVISKGTFVLGQLLQQPRIMISLWAVIVGALVVSAFDAVCDL
jgi:MFS family permease